MLRVPLGLQVLRVLKDIKERLVQEERLELKELQEPQVLKVRLVPLVLKVQQDLLVLKVLLDQQRYQAMQTTES